MNQNTRINQLLPVLAGVMIICLACGGSQVYENSKWRVILHSAQYEESYEYQSYPPPNYTPVTRRMKGFVVKMEIDYIGPENALPAPEISLKKTGGNGNIKYKYSRWTGLITDKTSSIKRGLGKIGKDPETGKKTPVRVELVFPLKDRESEYVLIIGDLEPIKL